jgi:hypothetical protein
MKLIRFHIKSLSPGMLQNPATADLLESLRTKKPVQKKTDITLVDDAKIKLYRSEPYPEPGAPLSAPFKLGKMGIPMQNIMSCVVLAGQLVKSGKKALSTTKSTTIFGFLTFVEDFCPFKNCDVDGNVPWKPFPVKGTMHNGASEVAVCINRPRIFEWETMFTVKFDETIDITKLEELVKVAGRQIGLGDWRPAKKGRFGRFVITKIETLPFNTKEEVIEKSVYTESTAPETACVRNKKSE